VKVSGNLQKQPELKRNIFAQPVNETFAHTANVPEPCNRLTFEISRKSEED
jgi:hypothetical protein